MNSNVVPLTEVARNLRFPPISSRRHGPQVLSPTGRMGSVGYGILLRATALATLWREAQSSHNSTILLHQLCEFIFYRRSPNVISFGLRVQVVRPKGICKK